MLQQSRRLLNQVVFRLRASSGLTSNNQIDSRAAAYLLGYFATSLGSFMLPVALALSLIAAGYGAETIGLVLLAGTVPILFLAPFTGILADRVPRRWILVICDVLRAGVEFAFAFALLSSDHLPVALYVLFAATMGIAMAFEMPASFAFPQEIVGHDGLHVILSYQASARSVARIAGPLLAGALAATQSVGLVIILDAISFLCNGLLLARLNLSSAAPRERGSFALGAGWGTVLKVLRENRKVTGLLLITGSYMLLVYSPYLIIGPLLAARLDPTGRTWSLICTFEGVGAVIGGLAIGRVKSKRLLIVALIGLALACALPMILATQNALPVILVAAVLMGIGLVFYSVIRDTYIQRQVDSKLLSSIGATDLFIRFSLTSASYAITPALSKIYGDDRVLLITTSVFIGSGALIFVVCGLAAVRVAMRSHLHK